MKIEPPVSKFNIGYFTLRVLQNSAKISIASTDDQEKIYAIRN